MRALLAGLQQGVGVGLHTHISLALHLVNQEQCGAGGQGAPAGSWQSSSAARALCHAWRHWHATFAAPETRELRRPALRPGRQPLPPLSGGKLHCSPAAQLSCLFTVPLPFWP